MGIKARGGQIIEEEALKRAPIGLSEVIITNASKLRAKFILHTPTMKLGSQSNEEIVKNCTFNCLRKADKEELRTIAFPALGCGIGRVSMQKGAENILKEIMQFTPKFLDNCIVVLHNDSDFDIFKKTFANLTNTEHSK